MPTVLRTLVIVVAAATAACNATGATAIPTQPAPATGAPSAAVAASGPTAFTSTAFGMPFSLTLPAGWKVAEDSPDMFTAYLSTAPETFDVAVDIQLVPAVYKDPCNKAAGTESAGTTAADLATWMLAYAPLASTAGSETTINGSTALVVDEAWAGAPCENGELWATPGGWLDAPEQKRFFIFEVAGKRLVAAIASSNEQFAAQVDAGLAVLASLKFR
jgi:hypothetical protein